MTRFKGKIITSEKYNETKGLRNSLLIVLTIGIILVGRRRGHDGLITRLFPDTNLHIFVQLVTIAAGVLLAITYLYSRNSNKKGHISINENEIEIKQGGKAANYPITAITKISITQSSYVEPKEKKQYPSNYHGNNFISFHSGDDYISYEFSIDSGYMAVQLEKLSKHWENSGIEHNFWKKSAG